jgi:hypothetical protein
MSGSPSATYAVNLANKLHKYCSWRAAVSHASVRIGRDLRKLADANGWRQSNASPTHAVRKLDTAGVGGRQ